MSSSAAPVWDLSDLYSGIDDPRLDSDSSELLETARAFEQRYRGRIAASDLTAETLRAALDEYEALGRRQARPIGYAGLVFSSDTANPAHGALLQRMQEEGTRVSLHLIFFDLELGKIPDETFERLASDPLLTEYAYYLRHVREEARHHLSEPEEKVIAELSNTGSRAFTRLFSELSSQTVYRVKLPEGEQTLTQSRTMALLYDPRREVRAAAAAAITETCRELARTVTFIYNNLLVDKATKDRLRGYEYPEQSRHLDNDLQPEVVQAVVDVCVANYGVVADYYHLKRRLLGLERMDHADRYAPISEVKQQIPFDEASELVLNAFAGFNPRMREMAEPFFTRSWIDAELRDGKRGGAFCSYIAPDIHPYVFMNYTEGARDVMTLAHELGHALHGVLASGQHFLNFYPSLPMAETASVFAEMLVFENLQQRMESPRDRLALLAGKIEDSFATVFRQATMYRFEQAAHRLRREHGEQPPEKYNELWNATMQEMFGDSLTLPEEHGWWWTYIPHIFATPFYVYAYAFGELLVLSLYARYKQEGEPFVERYFDLLAAGSSDSPARLLARLGIDIAAPSFWQGGVDLIRGMVDQAQALAAGLEG